MRLFVTKCSSCHTIGAGVRVGPDLKGALERRSVAWLKKMIKAPSQMVKTDPVAIKLLAKYKAQMPDLGLPDAEIDKLIQLLATCSARACDLTSSMRPVREASPADIQRGLELFTGQLALSEGGPACISCHTLAGLGGLIGGGMFAKDLSNIFAVLGDKGVDAALLHPAGPLEKAVFADRPLSPQEAFALRALLNQSNRGKLMGRGQQLSVPLVGLLLAILALVVLQAAWPAHQGPVRRRLVARKEHQP